METNKPHMEALESLDALCPISPLAQRGMIEVKDSQNGKRYRIKGIAMAWCNSLIEALRVAHILIRSGHVPPIDQAF
jgi:hypothetical protein